MLGPTLRKLATAATFNPSLPYLSFLCINFDAPVVKEAASWFLGGVFLNYNSSYLERALEQMLDEDDSAEVTRFLRAVDVRIDGFRVEKAPEGRGQLIFSSQDVFTMRNDVFRRDEIWFAARGEGEASQLWSLADIHEANGNLVSKNAAFDKQYLSGRYGADPYLTRIEEWD